MGLDKNNYSIYVRFWFKITKKNKKKREYIRYTENKLFTGSTLYASINALKGC